MDNTPLSHASFGDVMKTYRTRGKVTQRQLAAKLGVHYNTVWGWERGDRLPETRGMVLELAKHLRLNDQETRDLLEASLTAISPHWNVPYLRNPFFTGRTKLLHHLHEVLSHEQNGFLTRSYALSGLGGIGKTQTALEYAYRYYQHYTAVFWIGAEVYETIASGFACIADLLNLPEQNEKDQNRMLAAVTSWLTNHRGWLLIMDNVEDLGLVKRFLPAARHGSLLLTTRMQTLGTLAHTIEMKPMTPEESITFLLRRARLVDSSFDPCKQADLPFYETAREIANILAGLPLALDQASAYIDESRCGLSSFLDLFQIHSMHLLTQRNLHADHPLSVVKTFVLAFEKIQLENPAAADLLSICAFLAPDAIPVEMLLEGAPALDSSSSPGQTLSTELTLNEALATLGRYSMVHRDSHENTLTMHRLVQAGFRNSIDQETQRRWIELTVQVVNQAFPDSGKQVTWLRCQRYLPHAQECASLITQWDIVSVEAGQLLTKLGGYLRERKQYTQAEPLLCKALDMLKQTTGERPLDLALCLSDLALLYHYQGKYAQAEPLYQQSLTIRERLLGSEHSEVAECLNNLAGISYDQGKYLQAMSLMQQALAIREKIWGPEHLEVATCLSNLGSFYTLQDKSAQAESFLLRALAIRKKLLGTEHPYTLSTMAHLAICYNHQRRYEEAENLLLYVLSKREQIWGAQHLEVARALNNLAFSYLAQGRREEAEPLAWRALSMREHVLGPEHPEVASDLENLARIHIHQGKFAEAEAFVQRALSIRQQALGLNHPKVADSLHTQAILYGKLGRYREAEASAQRALSIREQVLGSEHADVARSSLLLANLSRDQCNQ